VALDLETTVFVLHITTIAVVYVFLFLIALLVWRDVRGRDQQARAATARLVVLDGGATDLAIGQRLPVASRAVTTLGRSSDSTVCLPEASVSATHATITWRASRWWIEDQDSLNGTALNDSFIEKTTLLCPGDVIAMGQVRLRFEV
jgi:pSer/pThr/pTyr-binding forkhead associated (FHA) protein